MTAATPAELQKAEEFRNTRAKDLRGAEPLRAVSPSSPKFQAAEDGTMPEASLPEEIVAPAPTARAAGPTAGSVAQNATSGLLRNAWSALPFGLLNPFLGILSLLYINLHFVLAYLGGPISQFFNKFGTEWIDAFALAPATGAVKETAAGKMLVATLELGEIFIMLVLDSLIGLVALSVIALVGAILQVASSPLDAVPGLAT